MKYYSIVFPGQYGQHVEEIWSEKQILNSYFPYWTERMVAAGHGDRVNETDCLEDWKVVHWAVEVPKPAWITHE
jgi:hypothetical protein